MNKILELREKRAKTWENAKNFLDNRRNDNGLISDEDNAVYEKMEAEVVSLGKEIDRLERQAAIDLELSKAVSIPIKEKPAVTDSPSKTGRASDEYKNAFWKLMRNKAGFEVKNALQIGTDSEGGSFKRLSELFGVTGQIGLVATQRVDGKLILPEAIKILKQKA